VRNELNGQDPVASLDAIHARVCSEQLELLHAIRLADRPDTWRDSGARDLAHFLAIRYGISEWKARRWIAAANALEHLPAISEAFASGRLGIDKVVELARFATAETEDRLLRWAGGVSAAAIRHRGDVLARRQLAETREAERTRSCSWWFLDDGERFGMYAEMPTAQGAVVAKALEREMELVPAMPGEDDPADPATVEARRADALVALCSARLTTDPDADRATVVVHARLDGLLEGSSGCELEDGPVIHPVTAQRLACSGRIQIVVEDDRGEVVRVGRTRREPPAWMARQLRYRDRECRFPGCGSRRFAQAHHIVWWGRGGRTELDNLVLICSFHHRLVHEHGWRIERDPDGVVHWFRPNGTRYRAGPAPPLVIPA